MLYCILPCVLYCIVFSVCYALFCAVCTAARCAVLHTVFCVGFCAALYRTLQHAVGFAAYGTGLCCVICIVLYVLRCFVVFCLVCSATGRAVDWCRLLCCAGWWTVRRVVCSIVCSPVRWTARDAISHVVCCGTSRAVCRAGLCVVLCYVPMRTSFFFVVVA